MDLLPQPSMPFSAFAGSPCCCLTCSSLPSRIPSFFSAELLSSWLYPASTGAQGAWSLGAGLVVLHEVLLSPFLRLLRCRCSTFQFISPFPPSLVWPAVLLRVRSIPSSRLLTKMLMNVDPWGTHLVTICQLDFVLVITTLWALLIQPILHPCSLSTCVTPGWLKGDYGKLLIALPKSWQNSICSSPLVH